MAKLFLDEKNYVDTISGCTCRYVQSNTEDFQPHYHNYYEIFLVLKGRIHHTVNKKTQILNEGDLLFIRDFDEHYYKSINGGYFDFINLSFQKKVFQEMKFYLGNGFYSEMLINSPLPPMATLTKSEKEKLFFSFTDINQDSDKKIIKLKSRILLLNIFTKYFNNYSPLKTDIPLWLELTYEKIKKPQNFIMGIEKMVEISGKTREHLSRSLKKYYNTTPSALILELRVNYAANLLINSNLSVIDICYECGFENMSWFYKNFVLKFGVPPAQYRKNK